MVATNSSSKEDKVFGEILNDLSMFRSNHQHKDHLTDGELITKESDWTEILIKILDHGNRYALFSFQYRIVMKANDEIEK